MILNMNEKIELIQESILRDISEGILVIGQNGSIRYFNRAAMDILDKTEEELSNRKLAELFFDNTQNDMFSQTILDAVGDLSVPHYNLVQYHGKKRIKTIYMMTSFLKEGREKAAIIVILNDMTDLVLMQKSYTDRMNALMQSLVQALLTAIDERSHYSANHTKNMVSVAKNFLNWLDITDHAWKFDQKGKDAFLMSVWLHDVGKLSVPLEVMDKATRLGTKMETIEERFQRIHLLDRIALLEGRINTEEWEFREENRKSWLDFIRRVDKASFLSDDDLQKIHELSRLHYTEENGTEKSFLTDDELDCLSIRKGTLTDKEREIMQSHVILTGKILEKVDFPDDFRMVREWARSHHELLNGKGYPEHKCGDDIPKEVRLLTILDIFEALTASDRPYKKSISVQGALHILHSMADEGSIDKEILALFEQSNAWEFVVWNKNE